MINRTNLDIFTGTSNPDLAHEVAKILGQKLGNIVVDKFSDGETKVELQENVRGHETYYPIHM